VIFLFFSFSLLHLFYFGICVRLSGKIPLSYPSPNPHTYTCAIYIQYPAANPHNANLKARVKERKEERSPKHTGSPPALHSLLKGEEEKNCQPDSKKSMYHKGGRSFDRAGLVFIIKYPCGRMMSSRILTRFRNLWRGERSRVEGYSADRHQLYRYYGAKGIQYSCQRCGVWPQPPASSLAHNQRHSKECLTAQSNFSAQCKLWLSIVIL